MRTAADFDLADIDPLNTVAIEVVAARDARIVTLAPGLADSWFENDGQLTKAEIRALTLAALAPRAGELLWDIGAGRRLGRHRVVPAPSAQPLHRHRGAARAGRAGAAQCAASSARRLSTIRIGPAPEALAGLPAPDAVFIGGGVSEPGVFEAAWAALQTGGRLVVNAVTLETETLLGTLYARHGGTHAALRALAPRGVSAGCTAGGRRCRSRNGW